MEFPSGKSPLRFKLDGWPGIERLKVIAATQRLSLSFKPDYSVALYRDASVTGEKADIEKLTRFLERLPETEWSEATCEYELQR